MYKIVSEHGNYLSSTILAVENQVNKLKKEGWIEQGGVSISHSIVARAYVSSTEYYTVAQAMVKNNKD